MHLSVHHDEGLYKVVMRVKRLNVEGYILFYLESILGY